MAGILFVKSSCVILFYQVVIGYGINSDLCVQGCNVEPHISCSVHSDEDCSSFINATSDLWPSAPENLHITTQDGANNGTGIWISWTMPDDGSFKHVTGFLLRAHLLQGFRVTRCVHIDLTGTKWILQDLGKQISLPWDCTGMPLGKNYHLKLYSLPLASTGTSEANSDDLFLYVPERDDGSAKYWSPTMEVKQRHYTAKSGMAMIIVNFSLSPKFTGYDVSVYDDDTRLEKKSVKPLPQAKSGEAVFDNLVEGKKYNIAVQPHKDKGTKCTCEGSWPSCSPCLRTIIEQINVIPEIPSSEPSSVILNRSTIPDRAATRTEHTRVNPTDRTKISTASPKPRTKALRLDKSNTGYRVLVIVVGGVAPACVLVLVLIIMCLMHKGRKVGNQREPAAIDLEETNYDVDRDTTSDSIVPPDRSCNFSQAGTEYMKQINGSQSLAYKNVRSQYDSGGHSTQCRPYDIDNMVYSV